MSGILSRAEASPLSWNALTDEQREAVRGIARLFGDLSERSWTRPASHGAFDRFLPRIDPERRNHVALIAGERGIGKTAVLLTLLQMWSERERGESSDARKEIPDDVFRGRVVPVGLVDLQPLPEGTNLLVHLAGQLSRLVDAMQDGYRATGAHDGWNPMKSEEPLSRKRWRAFVQAAAAGWEGRLDARRGMLDPEAFALEFEEVERHRLDVPERFRELCDALAEEYPKVFRQQRGTPFFVISVDDADMNPKRVLELLDLVRTLWHPRVGFVITGNKSLFLDVLKKQLGFENNSNDKLPEAIFNKAMPIYQRYGLNELSLAARRQIVGKTLASIPVFDHPLKPQNLLDYLEVNRLASAILPENMRELRDFEIRLVRHGFDYKSLRTWHFRGGRYYETAARATARLEGPDVSDIEVAVEVLPEDEYAHRLHMGLSYQMILFDAQDVDRVERFGVALARTVADGLHINWPFPRWRTWLEYCAVLSLIRYAFGIEVADEVEVEDLAYWRRYGRCTKPTTRDRAFRTFIDVTLRYVDFRHQRMQKAQGRLSTALETLARQINPEPPSWEVLLRNLDELADNPNALREEREWATVHVTLFAAPEHGLSPDIANRVLERLKQRHMRDWSDVRTRLRELRLEAARKLKDRYEERDEKKPEPSVVIERIDARSTMYAWVSEISRIEPPKDDLMRLLSEFPNYHVVRQPATAASYFDLERWGVFSRHTSESLRNQWLDRIGALPRGGISAPLAALALWNEAIKSGVIKRFEKLNSAPTPEELRKRFELLGADPWGFTGQEELLTWKEMRFHRATFAWHTDTELSGTLEGVLFEVLWDVTMDAADEKWAGKGTIEWWQPIGTRVRGSSREYPWPVPAFSAWYDYRLFAESYNEQIRRIRMALESLPPDHDVGLYFADYYVRALADLDDNRKIHAEWSSTIKWQKWNDIWKQGQKSTSGARHRAFVQWCQRIPLLAAPESGLSADCARLILEALPVSAEQKDALRKIRRERVRHAGIYDEEEIRKELARIDTENDQHPWVVAFGAES